MEKLKLKATNRGVMGKKVRFLRREGITPVHVFGRGIQSEALQCDTAELQRTMAQAGKTRLIELSIKGAAEPQNVMVREVQRDPLRGVLLHVDLYQVRMAERMKVEVPILLLGEAPALKVKDKMLEQGIKNLAIECLPGDVPHSIEVDLSLLVDDEHPIRVKEIKLAEGIAVLDDPEAVVVRVITRRVEEEVPVKVAEAPAEEVAAVEGAPEEEEKEAAKEKKEEKG